MDGDNNRTRAETGILCVTAHLSAVQDVDRSACAYIVGILGVVATMPGGDLRMCRRGSQEHDSSAGDVCDSAAVRVCRLCVDRTCAYAE